MAPSDATGNNRNIGAQLQSILCTTAQNKVFENLLLIGLLVRKKLVHSEPFLDHRCEIWHLLSALCSNVRKKLYKCTSAVSALNYCCRIFFKTLSYLYEVVRKTFPPIFGLFAIFDRNIAKIVAPSRDECENCVANLKAQSLAKKGFKLRRNRPINCNAMRVRTMHPSNAWHSGLGAWQKNTPHFRTYSRRALYDLPQILHGDRARRAHQ